MWWIALVWILAVCMILDLHLIKNPSHSLVDKRLQTAIFIPIVGIFTLANAAGLIMNGASNDTHPSSALTIPLIIVGFMTVGFGTGLAIMMSAIYLHRLMTSGIPESLKIPSMILTMDPCEQSASALLQLGSAAVTHSNFTQYPRETFLTAVAAPIVHLISIFAALLLTGFAIFWMCVDYYALISRLSQRKIKPSLFWWSSIFPVSTVVTALAGL